MIKAVQNNNACELPKANANVSIQSSDDDDVTLNRRATSTATNSTATTGTASAVAAATAAVNDDEDDCVYISPDEAENGKSLATPHIFALLFFANLVDLFHSAHTH